jgi:hypothetical protein
MNWPTFAIVVAVRKRANAPWRSGLAIVEVGGLMRRP